MMFVGVILVLFFFFFSPLFVVSFTSWLPVCCFCLYLIWRFLSFPFSSCCLFQSSPPNALFILTVFHIESNRILSAVYSSDFTSNLYELHPGSEPPHASEGRPGPCVVPRCTCGCPLDSKLYCQTMRGPSQLFDFVVSTERRDSLAI